MIQLGTEFNLIELMKLRSALPQVSTDMIGLMARMDFKEDTFCGVLYAHKIAACHYLEQVAKTADNISKNMEAGIIDLSILKERKESISEFIQALYN